MRRSFSTHWRRMITMEAIITRNRAHRKGIQAAKTRSQGAHGIPWPWATPSKKSCTSSGEWGTIQSGRCGRTRWRQSFSGVA